MICLVDTPIDLANYVELNNLIVNLKGESDGKSSVSVLDKADFKQMKPKEKLYILAHGDKDSIGGQEYTAEQFAEKLLDHGLTGYISSIKLISCESGKATTPSLSFAEKLSQELSKQSAGVVKVKVTGFTDFAVTNQFGQTRAIDPFLMSKHQTEYDAIFKKWEVQVEEWQKTAEALPINTPDMIITNAAMMARLSKRFFAELYIINEKIVKSKQASKHKAAL